MHGLRRLQNDLGTKALFVALSVLVLLSLAAIFASPARADLAGAADGSIDQIDVETTTSVVETTTSTVTDDGTTVTDDGTTVTDGGTTVTDDGTTVEDSGSPSGEDGNQAPLQDVVADEPPLVADEEVEVLEDVPPTVDDAIEVVVDMPLVVEEGLDVVEAGPLFEDLLTVVDVAPIVEAVEDAPPLEDVVGGPVVADVVIMGPTYVVDMVPVLPLFVPPSVANPEPNEALTDSAPPAISSTREVVLAPQPIKDGSQELSGLFNKELVAEMTLFHLAHLTDGSAAAGLSASPVPEPETAALAAYVPIAGTMPVGGAGASSSTGSNHSGSGFSGGLDVFSFFAAMATLLALCLVGWIRDRSRYGRSVFPSHGGRPG